MDTGTVWTIGSILKWTEQYFSSKGVESPRLDAEVLLSHILQKERIYLYVHFDEPLEAPELGRFREMIKQRIQRIPVAYIIGEREFMGLPFRVSPAVLIPRPDTEILVEAAIERLKKTGGRCFTDIGTGSGAIALSVLHYLPESSACAVDLSAEALAVASENAQQLGLSERLEFFCGDLYQPVKTRCFDAILSNPPYIPKADIAGLEPEVREFEPFSALDGGTDGLDFYRRLVKDGESLLQPGGFMAFEVGIYQAQAVVDLAKTSLSLGNAEILKDYGGIDRVVILWKQEEK